MTAPDADGPEVEAALALGGTGRAGRGAAFPALPAGALLRGAAAAVDQTRPGRSDAIAPVRAHRR
jgi:hypothetical protein